MFDTTWIFRGYFDFSNYPDRDTPSQQVARALSHQIGGPQFKVENWPKGPQWRTTLWWRQGPADYAEAQFLARIPQRSPVLDLGISIEKGLEVGDAPPEYRMDRATWSWPRLVTHSESILSKLIPQLSLSLRRPVTLELEFGPVEEKRDIRSFVFHAGEWYERHRGKASINEIINLLGDLDHQQDSWVDVRIAVSFFPNDGGTFDAEQWVAIFREFQPIRVLLNQRT